MHLEMWSLKLLTSYYYFYRIRFWACSRMLREALSPFSGRKAARSGPWWPKTLNLCMRVSWQKSMLWHLLAASGEKSSKFSMGNPSSDLQWARCRPALAGRPGASKKSKTPFAPVRHWPITLAASRSRREKHVCDAFKKVVPGPTGGLETGRRSREGRERVEKVNKTDCVHASRPITLAGSSVPTRETCVRYF